MLLTISKEAQPFRCLNHARSTKQNRVPSQTTRADGQVVMTICINHTGNLESNHFSVLKPNNQNKAYYRVPNHQMLFPKSATFHFCNQQTTTQLQNETHKVDGSKRQYTILKSSF
jgi:alanine dehydrogenase